MEPQQQYLTPSLSCLLRLPVPLFAVLDSELSKGERASTEVDAKHHITWLDGAGAIHGTVRQWVVVRIYNLTKRFTTCTFHSPPPTPQALFPLLLLGGPRSSFLATGISCGGSVSLMLGLSCRAVAADAQPQQYLLFTGHMQQKRYDIICILRSKTYTSGVGAYYFHSKKRDASSL